MQNFEREIRLIGSERLERLQNSTVLVMGVGGVGSYAAEAITRAGVGHITVMDGDQIAESNLNRQLLALSSNIGESKAEIMAARIRDINPGCDAVAINRYYGKDDDLNLTEYDWIIDAIDDVDAKVTLIERANKLGINIISSMGTAGKLSTEFKIADISKTSVCPLAKVMRKKLREVGIEHLTVVYSEEKAIVENGQLGTISYVPATAGLKLAEHVIKEIIK